MSLPLASYSGGGESVRACIESVKHMKGAGREERQKQVRTNRHCTHSSLCIGVPVSALIITFSEIFTSFCESSGHAVRSSLACYDQL